MAFAKLKAWLKKVAARTIDDLRNAIGAAIQQITPTNAETTSRLQDTTSIDWKLL